MRADPVSRLVEQWRAGRRAILCDLMIPLLEDADARFRILDGGAGRADLVTFWDRLHPERVALYGFDPDPGECDRLNALADREQRAHRFYPHALWSRSGEIDLHIADVDASVYRPNEGLLRRWRYADGLNMLERMRVVRSVRVPSTTVDDWFRREEIPGVDFIKLNIQGAELEVLRGARTVLPGVLGLQLEASFLETYEGQPLLSDLDALVRDFGFSFFDFLAPNIVGRSRSPVLANVQQAVSSFRWPSQQIFEGHFLWLRDPIRTDEPILPEQVLKLAAFAELYGQVEYALELMVWLAEQLKAEPLHPWTAVLSGIVENATALFPAVYPGIFVSVATDDAGAAAPRDARPERGATC